MVTFTVEQWVKKHGKPFGGIPLDEAELFSRAQSEGLLSNLDMLG